MLCHSSCALGAVFLIANIYLMFSVDKQALSSQYMSTLSPPQKARYQNIAKERRNIYFKGLVLGIALSIVAVIYYKLKGKIAICSVVTITLITNFLFYIIHPKSDWMVLHLDSHSSREAWLAIYREMQRNYHIGFVLGIVAVGFVANGVCRKTA